MRATYMLAVRSAPMPPPVATQPAGQVIVPLPVVKYFDFTRGWETAASAGDELTRVMARRSEAAAPRP